MRFRNIAIYKYKEIDWTIVHAIARHHLGDFRKFARAVVPQTGTVSRSAGCQPAGAAAARAAALAVIIIAIAAALDAASVVVPNDTVLDTAMGAMSLTTGGYANSVTSGATVTATDFKELRTRMK